MDQSRRTRFVCFAVVLATALASGQPAAATHVTPVFVAGNPSCTSLGYDFGFKVEPGPFSGTYAIDSVNSVTIVADAQYWEWTSTLGIDAAISKGGANANVYVYDPPAESFGDTGLHSPINPNNDQPYAISHIELCFDYEVTVEKDATTSFTRTWRWDVDKSVAPASWDMFSGDSGTSQYSVAVTKTGSTDSDWAVAGTIGVANNTPLGATISSVADVVSGGIAMAVDCGVTFPHSLASGETLTCTYSGALPDGSDRVNTATVTTSGTVGGGSATAAVDFGDPTTVVVGTVNVVDSVAGALGTCSDSCSFTYQRTFTCDGDEGSHDNIATIVETGQSDSESVDVDCYELTVTKDADTSFDRTYEWSIDKSADQTELLLQIGQQFLVNYTVTLTVTGFSDDDHAVAGTIGVHNPAPIAARLTGVADVVSPAIAADVDCGAAAFPYTLAAGGTLQCGYSGQLPDDADRTNTATATLQNYSYSAAGTATPSGTSAFTGSAAVDFDGAAVGEFDDCVGVGDDFQGTVTALGTVCLADTPETFTYSHFVGPFEGSDDCHEDIVNTASFETGDTGATGQDSWTVVVEVACDGGCTLTPGYWKTHSQRGPAPYDDTWALVGSEQENTAFFLSGHSWHQVLWTAPAGNAYYILAHAYIATSLNILAGASLPAEVAAAWEEATALFTAWTPAQIGASKGGQQPRKRFLELAGLLDMYNNGLLGPGHCSEESTR